MTEPINPDDSEAVDALMARVPWSPQLHEELGRTVAAEEPGLRELFDNDRDNINAGGSDSEFGEYIVERFPFWAVPLAETHQNPLWA